MRRQLYFNSKLLPASKGEFVAWCDGMGTARCLSISLHQAANSVLKLHTAFSLALQGVNDVRHYPVMDGIYLTAPSRDEMNRVLRDAFCELANEFIQAPGTTNMHMMRAGVAFGPTLHGADIPEEAFFGAFQDGSSAAREALTESTLNQTRAQVLLSPAMVYAYQSEKLAPPFGIYVDDTAKTYPVLSPQAGGSYRSNLFQWWVFDAEAREIATLLYHQVLFYLSKSETHSIGKGYPLDSIRKHRRLAIEYFGGLNPDAEHAEQIVGPERG
jgi:hypothetical protein